MRYNRTDEIRRRLDPGAAGRYRMWHAESPLADAVMMPDNTAIRSLPENRRVDVNAAQPDGTTALHWAARHDDLETADLLIHAGANVKAANRFGVTPLALAATNGSAGMIEMLLKGGDDPNAVISVAGDTALMMAARTGKVDAILVFLNHGADVNKKNNDGQTPLMWAAAAKNAAARCRCWSTIRPM